MGPPLVWHPSETAFALHRDHLMVEIIAGWEPQPPEADQKHVLWAWGASGALAPHVLTGVYIILLHVREQERIPLAFGPNYEDLLALTRTFDPDDLFRSTIGHITPPVSYRFDSLSSQNGGWARNASLTPPVEGTQGLALSPTLCSMAHLDAQRRGVRGDLAPREISHVDDPALQRHPAALPPRWRVRNMRVCSV